jgi:hypothetical protein
MTRVMKVDPTEERTEGGVGGRGDPTVLGVTADYDDFGEGGGCGGEREAIARVRRGKERGGAAGSGGERRGGGVWWPPIFC